VVEHQQEDEEEETGDQALDASGDQQPQISFMTLPPVRSDPHSSVLLRPGLSHAVTCARGVGVPPTGKHGARAVVRGRRSRSLLCGHGKLLIDNGSPREVLNHRLMCARA
jgi:hypothetical protein